MSKRKSFYSIALLIGFLLLLGVPHFSHAYPLNGTSTPGESDEHVKQGLIGILDWLAGVLVAIFKWIAEIIVAITEFVAKFVLVIAKAVIHFIQTFIRIVNNEGSA